MAYTTQYPSSIPPATDIYNKTDDVDYVHESDFDGLKEELHAVMKTLGVNPQGEYADVAARLAAGGGGGGPTWLNQGEANDFYKVPADNDSAWLYWDLSTWVPEGAKGVILSFFLRPETDSDTIFLKSSEDADNPYAPRISGIIGGKEQSTQITMQIGSDRKIYYKMSYGAKLDYIRGNVVAYWT
jgi:hypothetical protein